ncbi:ATP-binding protein [Sporichthya sp.]|uniref:sensor histidine kinase n=1 Tax=Sporichthya sp. TaxID=65475 RepID=UPI0017FB4A79|nr:ATP-binding protein [Sporichthya sp.]MBA3743826.1 ATP-binding protein [Sporichthya sp.]
MGSRVDASLIAFGALIGLLIGLGAGLAYRLSDRSIRPPIPEREAGLPEGVAQVLSVLRSLAVVLDVSDQVIKASPAASAFGIVRAERLVVDELADLVANVRRDGRIRGVELELPRGPVGGGTLAVSARVAPLGMSHILVLIEDQTDARRVDAIRRDFVANVSHELKTPVGALRLLAEAVQDASDDPDAVVRFAGRMQHESQRLSHLVQELIDLSRLESRDPLKDAQPVGVDTVVEAAIDRTRELATAKGIDLTSHGENGLKVFGSEAQLVMALGNLIENAVNYSAGKTRVGVTVRKSGDLAEISVTDQGIGIPGSELQRIFERFYRVDPARSRMTGGTGLGLSIVKHIAQNHGGDVRVWSAEGSGSTFTLRLPLLTSASGTGRRLEG